MSAWREQWLEGWVTVGSVSECMERAMVGRVGNSRSVCECMERGMVGRVGNSRSVSECMERAMVGRVGNSRISE